MYMQVIQIEVRIESLGKRLKAIISREWDLEGEYLFLRAH
jgi:hypothetical protein